MITARAFAGKHYAVYGLARSGLATAEALVASGARVTAWDAKEEARAKAPTGVEIANLDEADLTQSLDCDVAVLLNITPDHLDRYESFEAYANSKLSLFHMQWVDDVAIAPLRFFWDDGEVAGVVSHGNAHNVLELNNEFSDWRDYPDAPRPEEQDQWPALQGPHNLENACAALGVSFALGLTGQQIRAGLQTYPGLPHRMERVREKDGVLFVNDSKATNPTATAPALAAFPSIRWILGGQAKTDNLDECAPHFEHVRSAYAIGEAGELFERLLSPHMSVKNCGKLADAVREAAADAEPGDTVLLSPASASFDQFRDFEDRGDQFRKLVGEL